MDVVFNQGARENLPSAITGGNLYFCTNGETFLDINNETRIQLNPPETLATQEKNGLLSKEDKIKIDNLDNLETTKAAKFVIGSSAAGYTAQTCDYLCDGTADDVEINAAITALSATGGEIILLDGTYNITNPITINKSNVTINGNGNNTILKRMWDSTSSSQGIIDISSATGNGIVKNLILDGNKATYTNTTNNDGIQITNTNYYTIQNIGIINSACYGVAVTSSNNILIGNIIIDSCKTGISIGNSTKNIVANNIIENSTSYAIELHYSNKNNIVNNINNNFTEMGIRVISSGENNIVNNNLVKTSYSDSQYSIFVYGPESTKNIISNNLILGKDIEIQGATGNSVYGNKWKQDSAGVITSTTSEPGPAVQINADTLGGKPASNYATMEYVNEQLSGKAERYIYNSTLNTTWSGSTAPYTQTIAISGITTDDTPHITPIYGDNTENEMQAWSLVTRATTANGSITFYCYGDKPTISLNLQIEVIK